MIVDLMRNDLGRVCAYGSVVADEPAVQAHAGVWHLVSTVRGTLRNGVGDGELLRAAFPPGSVTGAPKVQAMKVIAELEATRRERYTGAIGIVSPIARARSQRRDPDPRGPRRPALARRRRRDRRRLRAGTGARRGACEGEWTADGDRWPARAKLGCRGACRAWVRWTGACPDARTPARSGGRRVRDGPDRGRGADPARRAP